MELLTEFFKPTIKVNQEKFFKELEKEVDHNEIKANETEILKRGETELAFQIREHKFKCVDPKAWEKSWLIDNLYADLALSVLNANVTKFKENLYAISTMVPVEQIIKKLKGEIHFKGRSETISSCLLRSIHEHTMIRFGDPEDKEQKYYKSDTYLNHLQLINLFKKIDLTELLKNQAKLGQTLDVKSKYYSWKIPDVILEYIEKDQVKFQNKGQKMGA